MIFVGMLVAAAPIIPDDLFAGTRR